MNEPRNKQTAAAAGAAVIRKQPAARMLLSVLQMLNGRL